MPGIESGQPACGGPPHPLTMIDHGFRALTKSVAASRRKGKNLPLPEEFSRGIAAKIAGPGEVKVSFLLLAIGVFALVAGLIMVGFGVPINEFSFGNTLISAGTTAAVGGLIIIALGVAVGQLRQIADVLTSDIPTRYPQPMDLAEASGVSSSAAISDRVPFPPRPNSETPLGRMGPLRGVPADTVSEVYYDQFGAPTLPNPDEGPMAVEDEIALSPPQPSGGLAPKTDVRSPADRSQEPAWKPSPPLTSPV